MKDEIKEILNNADSNTKFKMVDEDGTEKEMNIAGLIEQLLNDNKYLLDCITNLQKNYERIYNENCKLREKHNITDISLLDENNRLQEENEKLKKELSRIIEIVDLNQYNYGYQIKEEITSGGDDNEQER